MIIIYKIEGMKETKSERPIEENAKHVSKIEANKENSV